MFAETLLESSPKTRKRKGWPMATAFTVESLIAAAVVIVPLLSTGVIPLSARVQITAPVKQIQLEPIKRVHAQPDSSCNPAHSPSRPTVVAVVDHIGSIYLGAAIPRSPDAEDTGPDLQSAEDNKLPTGILPTGNDHPVKPGPSHAKRSFVTEAQVINRVEPVYPRPAILAGIQGEVKLHAVISREGRIMSLNVISGNPLLVQSARDAVSQWRYRPYFLNGQPVEVETFITVNFRKEGR
jgi:periplasmic protein TonB